MAADSRRAEERTMKHMPSREAMRQRIERDPDLPVEAGISPADPVRRAEDGATPPKAERCVLCYARPDTPEVSALIAKQKLVPRRFVKGATDALLCSYCVAKCVELLKGPAENGPVPAEDVARERKNCFACGAPALLVSRSTFEQYEPSVWAFDRDGFKAEVVAVLAQQADGETVGRRECGCGCRCAEHLDAFDYDLTALRAQAARHREEVAVLRAEARADFKVLAEVEDAKNAAEAEVARLRARLAELTLPPTLGCGGFA